MRLRQISLFTAALVLMVCSASAESRFVFTSASQAKLRIDTTKVSNYKVPPEFFGKFTENLGYNVYGGIWGQELVNPSLEPIKDLMPGGKWVDMDLTLLQRMSRENLVRPEMNDRIGYVWLPWNGKTESYSLSHDAFNTNRAQEIVVDDVPATAGAVGIRQPIYLPVHRKVSYKVSCYVKDTKVPVIAQISSVQTNKLLGKTTLGPAGSVDGDGWQQLTGTLELKSAEEFHGAPLWFCLGMEKPGRILVDQITLFASDNKQGFEAEVVDWLKDYGVSLLRFPGGNYVSGYHWKDDLTPLVKRLTKANPAWPLPDPHHVGTDEYIALCKMIGAEPLICVNAGNGTPEEAADWLEYCNGSTTSTWGRVRAERGHPEPYNVRWWELGNELWGRWQIGHCTAEENARRYRAFHDAMIKRDPTVKFIACGHWDLNWNEPLIEKDADIIPHISVHLLHYDNRNMSPVAGFMNLMGYSYFHEDFFRRMRKQGAERGTNWQVAVTELLGVGADLNYLPRGDLQTEAMYFVGTFNSAVRTEGDVSMITYSALANHGGGLRRDMGIIFGTPVYYARRAMKPLSGANPVAFTADSPYADMPEWKSTWMGETPKPFPLLDAMPYSKDGKLYIVLMNRDPENGMELKIQLDGRSEPAKYRVMELAAKTFMAMNEPFEPKRVFPTENEMKWTGTVSMKPASIMMVTVE